MDLKKHKNNFKNIYLISIFPNYIFKVVYKYNYMIEFYNEKIVSLFYILNKHYNIQLKTFIDLVSIDIPKNNIRFQNIYNCLSINFSVRLLLKTYLNKYNSIESIINIYSNAN
jgi:NADH:ubiquinone oxidoreductase subunit C